jgi:exopolyphosphatase/guanosine-5'-triphosphate,3'-diphosphate pyrophosphatase
VNSLPVRHNSVIAAIDVGTNSVHMVVAKVGEHGFHVLSTEKETVRLGAGVSGADVLSDAAIERAVNALRHMKRIAEAHSAEICAVATSAVREASNSAVFLQRARDEVGINVEIISGNEEARLIHLGVQQSIAFGSEAILSIDIGGGSTEFCVSTRGRLRIAQSLKVGAVRLTDAYLSDDQSDERGIEQIRAHVGSVVAPLAFEIRQAGFSRVVVSSGTCETLARMIAFERDGRLPQSMNGFAFTAAELSGILKKIYGCTSSKERQDLDGMDAKRSDIIVAGGAILHEIMKALHIETFEFSEYALREGVLVNAARVRGLIEEDSVDAGLGSVMRLAERCSVDLVHSSHVAMLSRKVLSLVSRRFEVDTSLGRLLESAALVANTGNAVSYSKHHLHSYYIIRNADLMGFTDEEIDVIALTARYHRKGVPKASHTEFGKLSEDRQHDVELMAGIIRIATGLDRSHDQSVTELNSSFKDGLLTITPRPSSGSDETLALNIFTAQERVDLLEDFLGCKILISR